MTNRLSRLRSLTRTHEAETLDWRAAPGSTIDVEIPLSREYLDELEARPAREVKYESYNWFAGGALRMHDLGWTVIPQQRSELGRRPGIVDGRSLKWGRYVDKRPTRADVEYWVKALDPRTAYMTNSAIILGAVSGNTLCMDVDVADEAMNTRVQRIIAEELGDTMARTGNAPKTALIYRVEDAADLPQYGRFLIHGDDGTPTGDAIEILGRGRLITAWGRHWRTENIFSWNNPPILARTKDAALVTPVQLQRVYERFAAELPLYTPARGLGLVDLGATFEGADVKHLKVPHVAAWGSHQWAELDGLVIDGREQFIYQTSRGIVRHNPRASAEQLMALVVDRFRRGEHPDRAWTEAKVRDQAWEKVHSCMAALRDGRIAPAKRRQKVIEPTTGEVALIDPIDRKSTKPRAPVGPTSFLAKHRTAIPVEFTAPDPAKAAARALQTDRAAVGSAASDAVVEGIDAFLDDVIQKTGRVHVVKGATGIGKSTQAVKRLATRHGEIFVPATASDGTALGPMLMIVPTYSNIDDLRGRADMLGLPADADDDELVAAADDKGIVAEGDLKDYLAQLRRFAVGSRLSTLTYKGKVRAGCLRAEEMKLLQAAHVPTSGMCTAKVTPRDAFGKPTGGEPEQRDCSYYKVCPAIAQRKQLATADLVFLVRSFLTLHVPEEIQQPRGVIIDERCFDLLVHTTTMPLSTLSRERREPRLTKTEREAGMSPLDLLQDRQKIAAAVTAAARMGHDLAQTVADFVDIRLQKRVPGIELVKSARRVCGSGMTSQADLTPDLTLQDIQEMCVRPAGAFIGEEFRFWKLLEEQLDARAAAELAPKVAELLEANPNPVLEADFRSRLPKPVPDRRIRVLSAGSGDPDIQLNWRTEPNWTKAPLLLLDASTDEVLTGLAFGGEREVVVHDVPVSMNQHVVLAVDRRLSMKSLFPRGKVTDADKLAAASLLAEIRNLIAFVCGTHAHGRCLFVMPMKLRRAVLFNWQPPFNADFLHYGAVAGLDFARRHVCICMISRMELPVREVDGLHAALSYGLEHVEPLIDPLGTGQDQAGDELYPHVERHEHPMRDGGTARWDRQVHIGDLARRIQRQYRELELNQGAGRGRAVHRGDPVTIIAVTESVPDDLIADEVVGFEDLTGHRARFWDGVRRAGGVIDPVVLARYSPHLGEVEDFERLLGPVFLENPLIRSRYHSITARFADGSEREIFVAGHFAEWKDVLVGVLRDCGLSGTLRDAVPCSTRIEAAEDAPMDKIRRVLAVIDPLKAEDNELARLHDLVVARGEWRLPRTMGTTVRTYYRAGEGAFERMSATLGAWLALRAIDDEWVLTGKMDEDRAAKLGLLDVVDVRKVA